MLNNRDRINEIHSNQRNQCNFISFDNQFGLNNRHFPLIFNLFAIIINIDIKHNLFRFLKCQEKWKFVQEYYNEI
jgi:hypothetical protein